MCLEWVGIKGSVTIDGEKVIQIELIGLKMANVVK